MALYDCAMIGVFHTSRQPMRQFVDEMIASGEPRRCALGLVGPWLSLGRRGRDGHARPGCDGRSAGDWRQAWPLTWAGRFLICVQRSNRTTRAWPRPSSLSVRRKTGPSSWPMWPTMPAAAHPTTPPSCCVRCSTPSVNDIAVAAIWDPVTVMLAMEAGEGARLPMRIGGKVGPMSGPPLDLTVTVTKIVARRDPNIWPAARYQTSGVWAPRPPCAADEGADTRGQQRCAPRPSTPMPLPIWALTRRETGVDRQVDAALLRRLCAHRCRDPLRGGARRTAAGLQATALQTRTPLDSSYAQFIRVIARRPATHSPAAHQFLRRWPRRSARRASTGADTRRCRPIPCALPLGTHRVRRAHWAWCWDRSRYSPAWLGLRDT